MPGDNTVRLSMSTYSVAVDVVVGPGGPVNGNPGSVGLGVEGARGRVGLVGVDGDGWVALSLKVGTPRLVSLVPVSSHGGVIPVNRHDRQSSSVPTLSGSRPPSSTS